jgi:hypothetical protein
MGKWENGKFNACFSWLVLQASMSTGDRDIFPDILNIPNRNMAEQQFSMPQDHQVYMT